jgi:hypothetical protein
LCNCSLIRTLVYSGVPRLVVPKLSDEEFPEIFNELLRVEGRKLTSEQLVFVNTRINQEPTPLYVRLAVRVVAGWTSDFSCTNSCLAGGVRNLLNQLFDSMSSEFGSKLMAGVLSFITLSVEGVSDDEMVDLLSLDDDLVSSINKYWKTTRLPTRKIHFTTLCFFCINAYCY